MKSFSGTLQLQGNMNVEDKEICGKKKNQKKYEGQKNSKMKLIECEV